MFIPGEVVQAAVQADDLYAGEFYVIRSSFLVGRAPFVMVCETGDIAWPDFCFRAVPLGDVMVAHMLYEKWKSRVCP